MLDSACPVQSSKWDISKYDGPLVGHSVVQYTREQPQWEVEIKVQQGIASTLRLPHTEYLTYPSSCCRVSRSIFFVGNFPLMKICMLNLHPRKWMPPWHTGIYIRWTHRSWRISLSICSDGFAPHGSRRAQKFPQLQAIDPRHMGWSPVSPCFFLLLAHTIHATHRRKDMETTPHTPK